MINTTAFGKRIQEIMKYYHISASGFADAMGFGRSSISHILSGRNKPSLDFVMKITDAYPEAEIYWLLYGKGVFPKSEQQNLNIESTKIKPSVDTTPTPPKTQETLSTEQDLFSQPDTKSTTEDARSEVKNQNRLISIASNHKEVDQIVFFYKDGTFKVYNN